MAELSNSVSDWDISTGNSLGTPCCELLASLNCLPITDLPTSQPALDFSNGGYTGTIPTEIAKFTELTGIILKANSLSGSIPTEVRRPRN